MPPDGTPFPAGGPPIFLATALIPLSLVVASIGLLPLLEGQELPPEPAVLREENMARRAAAIAAVVSDEVSHRRVREIDLQEAHYRQTARPGSAILPADRSTHSPGNQTMRMFRRLLIVASMAIAWPAAAASLPNRPVPSLDLHRYAGQWYEIARLPMYFERECLDAVVATYTPNPDGTIHVHNTCRTRKGRSSVDGVARMKKHQPAALEVRFAPAWLTWLPMAWADYWVIEVDAGYQWAVIGGPGRNHLWILSRQPTMDPALLQTLVEHSRQRGYPVDRLMMTAPAGAPDRPAESAPAPNGTPPLHDRDLRPAAPETRG